MPHFAHFSFPLAAQEPTGGEGMCGLQRIECFCELKEGMGGVLRAGTRVTQGVPVASQLVRHPHSCCHVSPKGSFSITTTMCRCGIAVSTTPVFVVICVTRDPCARGEVWIPTRLFSQTQHGAPRHQSPATSVSRPVTASLAFFLFSGKPENVV